MKVINKKTRKAIEKSVRKALKKHGPTLVAGLASGIASSLATLAKTEAPGERGKSNLVNVVERIGEAFTAEGSRKSKARKEKKSRRMKQGSTRDHGVDLAPAPDTEPIRH